MQIGFHASHEQFPPSQLLDLARRAEDVGFDAVLSSDHLAPWSASQGHSGFAYAWLGAALTSTTVPYGVVTAPGDRYHPAVVAQALATLADLGPGRLVPYLGSGQALNEHVTGRRWPDKPERNQRLAECAQVIGSLLAGETVDHDGLVTVRDARLYSLPDTVPPLFAAALTPATAAAVAGWADGLITVAARPAGLREVVDAFRSAAGEDRPVHLQAHLSWADTDEEARDQALRRWRANALPPELTESLTTPEQFDLATRDVTASDLEGSVLMSSDLSRYADALHSWAALGIDRVYLHQVGPDQERFLDSFADRVLPQLR
jgi:probable non-F420 flavinoid oxidoreductase